MITMLISLGYVTGADAGLLGWVLCAMAYFAVCMAFSANRTRTGAHRVWDWFLVSELLVDLAWCLMYYFPDGYRNMGLGGIAGVLLWPAFLLVAGAMVTAKNQAE